MAAQQGLLGAAVLAFWNDVAPGGDDEFNAWHTREHVPERVGIEGFLRGRRYVAVGGTPSYFTLYETQHVNVLDGPAYVARLNDPTPWTRRALPLFRNSIRTACRVTRTSGLGIGGALATLRLGAEIGRSPEVVGWLDETRLTALIDRAGVVGVHVCDADLEATQVPTEERKLRTTPDDVIGRVLLVEGLDAAFLEVACREVLGEALERHRDGFGVYQLLYGLQR